MPVAASALPMILEKAQKSFSQLILSSDGQILFLLFETRVTCFFIKSSIIPGTPKKKKKYGFSKSDMTGLTPSVPFIIIKKNLLDSDFPTFLIYKWRQ